MSLIVEDGSGRSDAQAYCSVADADTYHANLGNTAWASLTLAAKESALRKGAQYLDMVYGPRWRGQRRNRDQSLDWSRFGVVDNDGYELDADVLPSELKSANAEMALRASSEDIMPDIDTPGNLTFIKEKVGPLERMASYTSRSQIKSYRAVDLLLKPLIQAGGSGLVDRG